MKPPVTHLLYLHGFRSSPLSTKARYVAAWIQAHRPDVHWWSPQLPPSPGAAIGQLAEGTADWPAATSAVIGSSLGGYYATVMAERTGWRAVLLNPAVAPARDLVRYVGEISAWHSDERFHFRAEFIDELTAMSPPALTHLARYCAVIAKGDEVLSWEEMCARYRGCRIKLLDGSDHAISDFDAHWPDVVDFLGL